MHRLAVAAGERVIDIALAAQLQGHRKAAQRNRESVWQIVAFSCHQSSVKHSSNDCPPESVASRLACAPMITRQRSTCGQASGVVYRCTTDSKSQCRSSTTSASQARRCKVRRWDSSCVLAVWRVSGAAQVGADQRRRCACGSSVSSASMSSPTCLLEVDEARLKFCPLSSS